VVTSSFLGETMNINESVIGSKSRAIKVSESMYNMLNETAKHFDLPLTKVAELWVKSPCCNALLIQDPFTGEILCSKCKTKYKVVKVE